ncbi:MAG: hypothetical protein IMZ53_15310 [Thermoplasmata archaeon]|nr:hypothetical protein [Acidobacteriota bacterium]MBE3141943.1 hypothetical protein [Thermoplasmata archaeon]
MELKNAVDKGFAEINKIRGQHVHEFTFEERAFDRAETAAHLASVMKEKVLVAVKNLTLFEIAMEWRKKVQANIKSMIESYDLILGVLVKIINELE